MDGTKRVRVELDLPSYQALRYFGLLRGVPIGSVMRRSLEAYARTVQQEFPSVRAHVLASMAAYTAVQELDAVSAAREVTSALDAAESDDDSVPF